MGLSFYRDRENLVKNELNKYKSANERELMAIFNCDPSWPVCLFDFSFKSKLPTFLSFRVGHDLTSFVKDDYFFGADQRASGKAQPDNALNMLS